MTLEARALTFGYRGRTVGRDLWMSVGPGCVTALLGPNGGGKTTLLRTVLGLLPPLSGKVVLDGRPLATIPIRERARAMAYVPQVHSGTFAFTVSDVVLMGRTAHGGLLRRPGAHDRAIAAAMLERLGLSALAERPYTLISGGERQLALIARALAQEPRIVILDEPTASLDFGNQGKVMRTIRSLAEGGLAVAFTTHDPNQALRYADRALLLRDGSLLAEGPATILDETMLAALYRAPVEHIADPAGGRAFLPG